MSRPLKFTGTMVTRSEVPGHTAITVQISGCTFKCKGCHSAHLREPIGEELTSEKLQEIINHENTLGLIDAVCILGCGGAYNKLTDIFK